MSVIISIITILTALLGIFVFQCKVIPCIIIAAAAAGLLFLKLTLFRKAGKLAGCLSIVLLCACLFVPQRATEYGSLNYSELCGEMAAADSRGKLEKGETIRNELEEKYGNTEYVLFLTAMEAIEREEYREADGLANFMYDHDAPYYCFIKEITIPQLKDGEIGTYELINMYKRAADVNPTWAHPARQVGILYLDQKEYDEAAYYLAKAYENTEEKDGQLCYFLGAALFEQGKTGEGLYMMDEALKLGVDETIQGYIAWYVKTRR